MLAFCPAPVVFHSVPSGTTWNHSETTRNRVELSGIDQNCLEPIGTSSEVLGSARNRSVPLGTCGAQKSTAHLDCVAVQHSYLSIPRPSAYSDPLSPMTHL